ncbi:family 78 glycoside hydrolase catalytic domain [Georgenia alba]|uniref:alpha-L-rhamnosidase n=1 Tax=Georgenia alba TaxID=2233858 RepID=A0ABW2Q399_9MICO
MAVRLEHLTVEHATEPCGVDVVPRFGWHVRTDEPGVRQRSWRVVVAGPGGEVWDSGEVPDDRCAEIAYAGPPLEGLTRYRWSVVVMTTDGAASGASVFVTGVLDGDWRGAEWVGGPGGRPAPLLRHEFDLDVEPAEALLVVAAGGYARVEVDGRPAGAQHLSPGFTDYDVTVQYTVEDVTHLLARGRHSIGAELGREFFGMLGRNTWEWERAAWHDEPCLRLLLLVRDAAGRRHAVVSGPSWRATGGPTRWDDLYAGEDHDARAAADGWSLPGFDDSGWSPARQVRGPRGRLVHQRQQPVGVVEELAPERVHALGPGAWTLSFPRVVAGWAAVEADEVAPGRTIELRFGEKLRADGSVDNEDHQGFLDGRFQTDRVTGAGGPLRWERRFGYHGFQHVEVRAAALPRVTARVARTLAPRTGAFACADPLLNRLHENAVATLENNLHHLPTDTPMYEKNGWTGDGLLGAEMMLLNLDVHELLAKWAGDIAASRHGEGAPAVIAPCGGWTLDWSPAPVWHAALLLVPWEVYRQRGDRRVLEEVWPDARDYLRFEVARWPDEVADSTLTDYLSPETSVRGGNGPEDTRIAATAMVARMCEVAARIARVLGDDDAEWEAAASRFRSAFVTEFYDADTAAVRSTADEGLGYRQTPAVLALAFDLLPASERRRVADRLAADVRERDHHLSTGALGTKHLLPVLTRFGHADVAWTVATRTTFPSWGFWVAQGATTMWEHWRPESRSRNHYFMGTVEDWLYSGVVGLEPLSPGWRRARVAPAVTDHLAWASGHVTTPQGRLAVHWRHEDGSLRIDVDVPVGTEAVVDLPGLTRSLAPGRHTLSRP